MQLLRTLAGQLGENRQVQNVAMVKRVLLTTDRKTNYDKIIAESST